MSVHPMCTAGLATFQILFGTYAKGYKSRISLVGVATEYKQVKTGRRILRKKTVKKIR